VYPSNAKHESISWHHIGA